MVAGIVLAGGAGRRMGGIDKALLHVGGVTMLDRVLDAVLAVCRPVVVVGPRRPTRFSSRVSFLEEAEPGGGPVPAVAAGLGAIGPAGVVVVAAVDLPLLTAPAIATLVAALSAGGPVEAAAAADHRGFPNPLLAAYRVAALPSVLSAGRAAATLLPTLTTIVALGRVVTHNVNVEADLAWADARAKAGLRPDPGPGSIGT